MEELWKFFQIARFARSMEAEVLAVELQTVGPIHLGIMFKTPHPV
jgi:hypothetical protein